MRFSQYFRAGQKIFLQALNSNQTAGRLETLTVYLHDQGPGYFLLSLPYGAHPEESYPFKEDMLFQIRSDAFGIGVQLTGRFQSQVRDDLIRLKLNDDFEVFQRRTCRRLDTAVGLRYTKGKGTLRTYRTQWEKNVQLLQQGDPAKLPPFPRVQTNLSATGIRFVIKPPIEPADLCLLLVQLERGQAPICTLAEVVWLAEEETDGLRSVGMRFLNILEADQEKIEKFIRERAPASAEA